jgi:long-chain acyl-CoA synthetase
VALYSKNRYEWVITDLGCALAGITTVTLYDTLGKESLEYILDQTKIRTVVTTSDKVKSLLDFKKEGKLPLVTHIISMDDLKQGDKDASEQVGVKLVSFATAIAEGRNLEVKFDTVTKDTLFTVCYTSGTTGMPKGAMLTQGNFTSNIGGVSKFDGVFHLGPEDVYISYLPLAHVFERYIFLAMMAHQC